eukprot:Nk52_evm103s226 gene=Nk52_evmTU103s226
MGCGGSKAKDVPLGPQKQNKNEDDEWSGRQRVSVTQRERKPTDSDVLDMIYKHSMVDEQFPSIPKESTEAFEAQMAGTMSNDDSTGIVANDSSPIAAGDAEAEEKEQERPSDDVEEASKPIEDAAI